MAPRRRKDPKLPLNLRERGGYFSYRHPIEGTEYGLGRDRRLAIQETLEANALIYGHKRKPLIERMTGDESRTWGKWCDEFEKILKTRATLSTNTERTRKSLVNRLRATFEPEKAASEINTLDCSAAIEAIKNEGKLRMAQAFRSFLIDCFDRMIARGWRTDNPARVTDEVKVKVRRARLTFSVFMKLYERTSVAWLRNAMALAIVSGQAREEVRKAQFSDFRDGGWWNERTKTGARIFLPMNLRLECFGMSIEDVVKQCRATHVLSKYLIHQTQRAKGATLGKPLHVDMITRMFKSELDALGIDWGDKDAPTFHEIRSLSGRLYNEQGNVNPQELFGHKDPRTTAVYTDGRGEWVRVSVK
jgi:hypothetical protein